MDANENMRCQEEIETPDVVCQNCKTSIRVFTAMNLLEKRDGKKRALLPVIKDGDVVNFRIVTQEFLGDPDTEEAVEKIKMVMYDAE
jgi:hypothetical protein